MADRQLETIQQALGEVVAELESINTRLTELGASIPDPQFEQGTDEPSNLAGQLYGLIAAVQQDELGSVILTLKEAVNGEPWFR